MGYFLLRMMRKARCGHVIVEKSVDEDGCFNVGSGAGCGGDGRAVALFPPLASRPSSLLRFRFPPDALD